MSEVGKYEEKILSDIKWHYRLPFCTILTDQGISIECATEEAMGKEIEYAFYANLDYWAFVVFPRNTAMSQQIRLFLMNKEREKVKFSLIIPFKRWIPKTYQDTNSYFLEFIKQDNFLKYRNKPVIFIFKMEEEALEEIWGGHEGFQKVLNDLEEKIISAGLEKPYYVLMGFNPEKTAHLARVFNFDAVTTYAVHCGRRGTYEELRKCAYRWWERAKKTGITVIPIVMSGWDPRPRANTPAPWQSEVYKRRAGEIFYTKPKPEEIADHLREGIRWAIKNKSPFIIIYAWNEFSEGGWIMPTLIEGDERIKEIRKVILEECKIK
ncbi:MAG: glycoside hydrolase family 99-like domain-containing protein [Candidatus Omnitrophica bacterium]|nr:glycoside hydrolase family 99-like domain-containing protein [Candidatus Omnitrophota bacterium]